MPKQFAAIGGILASSAAEPPALRALRVLRPRFGDPERIEILKGGKPSSRRSTYRLVGAGPGGSPLIAKRCPIEKARRERDIYEQVLPQLPVPSVRYYGFIEGTDCGWVFLEDVSGHSRYSSATYAERCGAGRWLGFLHTLGTHAAAAARLPVLDSTFYFGRLRTARARIEASVSRCVVPADKDVMRAILSRLADLEAEWSAVDRDCRAMPRSLTHGDFVAKNLYVRTELDVPQILPLDWGQAGWGPPGLDLAQSGGSCHGLSANADVEAYLEVVRHHWTGIDLPQVQAWARLGSLLRTIVAVEWASRSVGSDSAVLSAPRMRGYADPLAQTVRALRGERNRRPCA